MYTTFVIKEALRARSVGWLMKRKSRKLGKHIVVFESDDWGAIRMPSLETYSFLKDKGVPLRKPDTYDCLDTIESNDDIQFLIETLSNVRGGDGIPAVMTMNTVMCNPNFEMIEDGQFAAYYYETFIETYKRYPQRDKVEMLWHEGMANHVLRPQLHGREHLNIQRWMSYLQSKDKIVMEAFKHRVVSLGRAYHFQEALNPLLISDYAEIDQSIKEGLRLFRDIFGFSSDSFIAPCYRWDSHIEKLLKEQGVHILQGIYFQTLSEYERVVLRKKRVNHYLGEENRYGQVYLTRNCRFEPSENPKYNADRCLKEISMHLNAGRPAIVSCHRQNFIGALNVTNRDNNLKQFTLLLHNIVKHYPDVHFMSSDQLGCLLLSL